MGVLSKLFGKKKLHTIAEAHETLQSRYPPTTYMYFLSPTELISFVKTCAGSIQVSWEESVGMFSKDCLWVRLYDGQSKSSEMIEFIGLCDMCEENASQAEWLAT